MPLLTPSSKEMMSQALKATFSGFAKEQQRLGIPKGKTWLPVTNHGPHRGCVLLPGCPEFSLSAISSVGSPQVVLKPLGSFSWKNVEKSSPLNREAVGTLYQRMVAGKNQENRRNGWEKGVREAMGSLEGPDKAFLGLNVSTFRLIQIGHGVSHTLMSVGCQSPGRRLC